MDPCHMRIIPVTMLSGFLGAGKTTLLKYILERSTDKIACLVNDLAAVNIDSKLVRNAGRSEGSALSDMVELQNGCCCCSAADELFPAFMELIDAGDRSGRAYDRIVLENSGVAEPQNIRDSFNEAMAMGHPITSRIRLEGLITVVDAVTFVPNFGSRAPMSLRPDLGDGGQDNYRPVVDLLVEQIECSDVIVLNKADAVEAEKIERLKPVMTSLNPLAHVVEASFGQIPLELIRRCGIASKMNIEAQHRSAVQAAKEHEHKRAAAQHTKEHGHKEHGNGHSHGHGHGKEGGHHEHGHGKEGGHHDHGHGKEGGHHEHGQGHQSRNGHHHHHHHGHDHDHDHDHEHLPDPAMKYGISSFVYSRRRPFHPFRLRQLVLRWLPATTNTALQGVAPGVGDSPIRRVLRSKGFAWLANAHASAFYWSHAGQHFELREEGDWWATVHPANFPPDPRQKQTIYQDFDGHFGDRRQEIVFIGASMNEASILEQLDAALLNDEEMQHYTEGWASMPDPQHPDAVHFKHLPPPTLPSRP